MDMLCPFCREPWDNDTFHDVAEEKGSTYREVVKDFQSRGCVATGWTSDCRPSNPKRNPIIDATYELLGDDTDGAMNMLEDAEHFGYLD